MTISHGFDYLFEEYFGRLFIQFLLFLHVLQQLPALQVLHYYGDLHVLEGQAVVDSYDVVVFEGFQSFRLHENAIDFSCSAYLISFNNFDGKLLSSLFVLGQKDLSEPTFSQFLHHFVLPEATGGIKILTIGRIQHTLALDKLQIILKVLSTFGVKQPQMGIIKRFLNIFKTLSPLSDSELMWLSLILPILVHIHLRKTTGTIFYWGVVLISGSSSGKNISNAQFNCLLYIYTGEILISISMQSY